MTPDVLYEEVVEVEERLVLKQEKCRINKQCPIVTGTTGEQVGRLMNRLFIFSLVTSSVDYPTIPYSYWYHQYTGRFSNNVLIVTGIISTQVDFQTMSSLLLLVSYQ